RPDSIGHRAYHRPDPVLARLAALPPLLAHAGFPQCGHVPYWLFPGGSRGDIDGLAGRSNIGFYFYCTCYWDLLSTKTYDSGAMMHISEINTYPIKSCGRLSHQSIDLDARGPVWDRRWMVVDGDGLLITQRELPAMALIQPRLDDAHLHITAPNLPEMHVPLE